MNYHVYLRWPDQQINETTTTESERVANYAFCDLLHRYANKPCAASMTRRDDNDKPVVLAYYDLSHVVLYTCIRCAYSGPFIDDGETCPNCKLVQ
jgi:hypothetical protein